jgi:hypothetical protein
MRTNLSALPATYSASAAAASLPEAIATPFISSATVTICPGPRFMTEEPGAWFAAHAFAESETTSSLRIDRSASFS